MKANHLTHRRLHLQHLWWAILGLAVDDHLVRNILDSSWPITHFQMNRIVHTCIQGEGFIPSLIPNVLVHYMSSATLTEPAKSGCCQTTHILGAYIIFFKYRWGPCTIRGPISDLREKLCTLNIALTISPNDSCKTSLS